MARVIVILTLMVAITATMFAITRKPAIAPGEAANGPTATVKLTEVARQAPVAEADPMDGEETSLTSAGPRPVTNALGAPEPPAAQDVTNGPVAGAAPAFGTAGIDQMGEASFTGTASPGGKVTLVWNGRQVGATTADRTGNWEITFKARTVKDKNELYVSSQGEDGSVVIGPQRAVIGPPATEGGLPRITLKSAGEAEKTLQVGATVAEVKTGLVVEKIAAGGPGLTMLVGKADPGATVRVSINGKVAGETRVAKDGAWTLAAANPTTKASKRLRLELIGPAGAKLDEADLPYEVAAASTKVADVSAIVKLDTPPERKARAKDAQRKVDMAALVKSDAADTAERPKRKIIRVRRGDSLWRIARRHLGKGKKWAAFYKANKAKIDNPDLIYPGQTLVIPG